jgi:outer membrane protein assembly factor BamD
LTLLGSIEYRQHSGMLRSFYIKYWVLFLLGFLVQIPLHGALIYRPGEGWEVEGHDTIEETSKEQLDKGEKYEKEGKIEEAAGAYKAIVKTWPLSPNAPEGQFRFATMLYKLFEFQGAFKEFQNCLDKYPETEHFDDILKYQYDIACLFLAGERQKVWKIPTLPSMEKTVDMFVQVIKNGPYSNYAPMSQLKIGFAREKQHQWDDAVKAYQELIRKYPKSDLADDAQFQIGYAYMLASREADYDQTATNRSITGFEDYITKYPSSEKIEQAKDNIDRMKKEQARGVMRIAEYYDKDHKYDAAMIYYNNVIQQFPNTELATKASARVDELKQYQSKKTKDKPSSSEASDTNKSTSDNSSKSNSSPTPASHS